MSGEYRQIPGYQDPVVQAKGSPSLLGDFILPVERQDEQRNNQQRFQQSSATDPHETPPQQNQQQQQQQQQQQIRTTQRCTGRRCCRCNCCRGCCHRCANNFRDLRDNCGIIVCTKGVLITSLFVWWIGSIIAANVCCKTNDLPEKAHLNVQQAVTAYGIISISLVIVVGGISCIGGVSLHNENRDAGIAITICGGLSALTFLGLYLWVFFVGIILLAQHYDTQPLGLNILMILTDSHMLLVIAISICFAFARR